MLKKNIFSVCCACVILYYSGGLYAQESAQGTQPKEPEPARAAQVWLATVDQGQYEQSWETASSYFKSMVNKEQWVSLVAAARSPLGDLVSRSLNEQQYLTALPGAPDGQYWVLIFKTVFGNKASAIETVTVMKDKDGQWRLAGYFIK